MTFRRDKQEEPRSFRPKPPAAGSKIETVIGPNCHFQGTLQSDGGVRIDGVFQGSLNTTGNVIVGESAKVVADITAENVSVGGAVKGNITGNRVEVLTTGGVWGDLKVNGLLLNEGAYLRGQTMMHGDLEPPMIEPSRPAKTAPPPPPPQTSSDKAAEGEIVDIDPE